jgi:hypothetical protein
MPGKENIEIASIPAFTADLEITIAPPQRLLKLTKQGKPSDSQVTGYPMCFAPTSTTRNCDYYRRLAPRAPNWQELQIPKPLPLAMMNVQRFVRRESSPALSVAGTNAVSVIAVGTPPGAVA